MPTFLWARGLKKASYELGECGVEGVIVADLPNSEHWFFKNEGFSLPIVPFATPESTEEDIQKLSEFDKGFIYFVSVRGTTGASFNLGDETVKKTKKWLKKVAKIPVVLGFGISTSADAKKALELADGFVVGTRAVEALAKGLDIFEAWCQELLNT